MTIGSDNRKQSYIADNGGVRDDKGKPEFDLIPSDGLAALGAVYSFGAKKYSPRNWERGMRWSRCYNSLLRHLYLFWSGEAKDAESGLPHLSHVVWNAMALLVYSLRGIGEDDRILSSPALEAVSEQNKVAAASGIDGIEVRTLPYITPKQGMRFFDSEDRPWIVTNVLPTLEKFYAKAEGDTAETQCMHFRAIKTLRSEPL